MDSSRPSGQVVTQQNQEPWAGRQPFDLDVMRSAEDVFRNARPQFFPRQAVVPHSAATTGALAAQEQRALAGSPLREAGLAQAQQTLAGDYLRAGNPFTQGLIDRFGSTVGAQIDAQFAGQKGRFGSEGHIQAKTRGLGDALAGPLFGSYEAERARQFSQAQGAPALAETDYGDFARRAQVGAAREELGGRQLADEVARFEFGQNLPQQALSNYAGIISGQPGFVSQSTVPPQFTNPALGALGGGIAGSQMASLMGQTDNMLWPAAGAFLGSFA